MSGRKVRSRKGRLRRLLREALKWVPNLRWPDVGAGRIRRSWSRLARRLRARKSSKADAPSRPRRLWSAAVGLVLWPYRLGRLVARRARRVLASGWRHPAFRSLLFGLPAVLAGSGLVALAMAPNGRLGVNYKARAAEAFRAGDYATARSCFQRLVQMDPAKEENQFSLALTLEAAGETRRAAALINRLAPTDRAGYPRAHLWVARRLLAGAPAPAEAVRAAEVHLRWALAVNGGDADAHALYGQVCWAEGRLDEAEAHLRQAMVSQPGHELKLARIEFVRGNRGAGLSRARQAAHYFERAAAADPADPGARLSWAEALTLAEDYPGAVNVLRAGLNQPAPPPAFRKALAQAYAIWFDALGRDRKANDADRLALLETGLAYDPANELLTQRLVMLSRDRGKEAEAARAALRQLLAEGRAPASVHLLLGVDAYFRNEVREAQLHFQRAYELAPQMPEVMNNMAFVLAHQDPPDLERALALVNSALERQPDRPDFRDTRGQIFAKLGRWEEALKDLEVALPHLAGDPAIHRTLKDVYLHLGNPAMAKEHDRRAKEIKAPRR